jgi:hypothetical protein
MNTLTAENGVEVYENRFLELADEYISTLHNPDDIYSSSGHAFTGLIKYINRKLLRDNKESICADINLLNNIWELYVELVYRYNQKPTIEEYALLIGISRTTIYDWMNENVRNEIYRDSKGNIIPDFFTWQASHRGEQYSREPSSLRSNTIKKWQEECKLGRYKSAASGNVGGIFLCKAVDGMVETAPVQIVNDSQRRTLEQIEQERAGRLPDAGAAQLPQADF